MLPSTAMWRSAGACQPGVAPVASTTVAVLPTVDATGNFSTATGQGWHDSTSSCRSTLASAHEIFRCDSEDPPEPRESQWGHGPFGLGATDYDLEQLEPGRLGMQLRPR